MNNFLFFSGFTTSKITLETHIDPIKALPLTLGLFYSTFEGKPDFPDSKLQAINGFDYGWDVLTWTNLKGFGVSLRYGQALGGQYQFTVSDESQNTTDQLYQVKYSFVGVGLATPVTNSFGVLLEYRQRIESEFKAIGNVASNSETPSGFDGGMIMLGVEVSI